MGGRVSVCQSPLSLGSCCFWPRLAPPPETATQKKLVEEVPGSQQNCMMNQHQVQWVELNQGAWLEEVARQQTVESHQLKVDDRLARIMSSLAILYM